MLSTIVSTHYKYLITQDDGNKEGVNLHYQHPHSHHWLYPRHNLLLRLLRILHQVFHSLSRYTYRLIGERNKGNRNVKNVLDIGTATGGPLKTIINIFDNARVLGIDYNPLYIPACKKLFEAHENVEIRQMNYYDLEKEEPETMFDVIIFGSSFMILPDQTKAIEIAQSTITAYLGKLNRGGKIYFLLTLYEEKNFVNKILEYIKPMLKYLSTVDFGRVTYRVEFEDFLLGHELKINFSERLYGNVFLKMAKFYMYEVVK